MVHMMIYYHYFTLLNMKLNLLLIFYTIFSSLFSGLVPLWPEYQTGHAGHKSSIQPEREDVTPKNVNFNFKADPN